MVRCLRPYLLILKCAAKKKPPPKAGAPKHLSGVWPCFHLVRRFSSQTNHLYSTSTATGVSRRLIACPQTASRTLRRSLKSICHRATLPKPLLDQGYWCEIRWRFTQNAQSLGKLVLDGSHKPFHALAYPLDRKGLEQGKRQSIPSKQGRQQSHPRETANLSLGDLASCAGSNLSGRYTYQEKIRCAGSLL